MQGRSEQYQATVGLCGPGRRMGCSEFRARSFDRAQETAGIALVTGASRGIGATYAERLAQRGYDLILVARDQRRLEHLASRIATASKRKVAVIAADLSTNAGVARVENELEMNNRIHFVVNNAGAADLGDRSPSRTPRRWIP